LISNGPDYAADSECQWIVSSDCSAIKLPEIHIDTEACCDQVILFDSEIEIARLSGLSTESNKYNAFSGKLRIIFRSDSTNPVPSDFSGFAATWKLSAMMSSLDHMDLVPLEEGNSTIVYYSGMYHAAESITGVQGGLANGNFSISILGFGFNSNGSYICLFLRNSSIDVLMSSSTSRAGMQPEGNMWAAQLHTPAQVLSDTEIRCRAPIWGASFSATGSVTLAVQYKKEPVMSCSSHDALAECVFNFSAWVSDISPNAGFVEGRNGTITVSGYGFDFDQGYTLTFSTDNSSVESNDVLSISNTRIVFSLPTWPSFEDSALLAVHQKSSRKRVAGANFYFSFSAHWGRSNETIGFANGGSAVRIEGFGFRPQSTYACRFARERDHVEVAAAWMSTQLLYCTTPYWPYAHGLARLAITEVSQIDGKYVYKEIPHIKVFEQTPGKFWKGNSILVQNLARACGADINEACVGTQSTAGYGAASAAVDGNIDTQWGGGSCMHTDENANNPWWRVDFGREVEVTGLRVYNRGDCCQDWLQGFSVYVGNNAGVLGNAACAVNQSAPLSAPYTEDVTCDAPVVGQYMYIRLEGANRTLTLCEVQVQGYDSPSTHRVYSPEFMFKQGFQQLLDTANTGLGKLNGTLQGPASGGSIVLILAYGLNKSESYSCVFSQENTQNGSSDHEIEKMSTAATVLSHAYILCRTPAWGAQFASSTPTISIQSNSEMVLLCSNDTSVCRYQFYDTLASSSPFSGLVAGEESNITIRGFGFSQMLAYSLVFSAAGTQLSQPSLSFVSSTSLIFQKPTWPGVATACVLSLRNTPQGQIRLEGSTLFFVFTSHWERINVSSAPAQGAWPLEVQGFGFRLGSEADYSCQFARGSLIVSSPARALTSTTITCLAPYWPYSTTEAVRLSLMLYMTRMPQDNSSWSNPAGFGACASYLYGMNHGWCVADSACDACAKSCERECALEGVSDTQVVLHHKYGTPFVPPSIICNGTCACDAILTWQLNDDMYQMPRTSETPSAVFPMTRQYVGSFSDGGLDGVYASNARCEWLISASSDMTLRFSSLDIEEHYDQIVIQSCSSANCIDAQVIARLSGSSVQPTQEFKTSRGFMLVSFLADDLVTGPGFAALVTFAPLQMYEVAHDGINMSAPFIQLTPPPPPLPQMEGVSRATSHGPATGGNIVHVKTVGLNVSRPYQCVFFRKHGADWENMTADSRLVSSTDVQCPAPNWCGNVSIGIRMEGKVILPSVCELFAPGNVSIRIRLAGADIDGVACDARPAECSYLFLAAEEQFITIDGVSGIAASTVSSGSVVGGSTLTVAGFGFDASLDYSCRFVGVGAAETSQVFRYLSERFLVFTVPAWQQTAQIVSLEVLQGSRRIRSHSGSIPPPIVQATASYNSTVEIHFFFVSEMISVEQPDFVDRLGGQAIVIRGQGFGSEPGRYLCQLSLNDTSITDPKTLQGKALPASFMASKSLDGKHIVCTPPAFDTNTAYASFKAQTAAVLLFERPMHGDYEDWTTWTIVFTRSPVLVQVVQINRAPSYVASHLVFYGSTRQGNVLVPNFADEIFAGVDTYGHNVETEDSQKITFTAAVLTGSHIFSATPGIYTNGTAVFPMIANRYVENNPARVFFSACSCVLA
jgi:hypothetical protein